MYLLWNYPKMSIIGPCISQQAITWANVDPVLCHHMAPLGHNELTQWSQDKTADILWMTFSDAFCVWKILFID